MLDRISGCLFLAVGVMAMGGCPSSPPSRDAGGIGEQPDSSGAGGRVTTPGTGGVRNDAGAGGTKAGSGGKAAGSGSGGTVASGSGGKAAGSGSGGTVASGSGGSVTGGGATPFTFVAWGDTKDATGDLSTLSEQAAAFNPQFTIYAGDLVNSFSASAMDEWTAALDGSLTGQPNGIAARTFAVRGNHDDSSSGYKSFMAAHNPPAQVAARVGASHFQTMSGRDHLVYSFDVGNSHFVGLDVMGEAFLMPADQIAWLDSDLAAAEARGLSHAFLFFHGPIYCATPDSGHCCTSTTTPAICDQGGVIASLLAVLDKHPIVTATFHGHEHVYNYTNLTSARIPGLKHPFRQFITGSAGASPNNCDTNRYDYCMSAVGFTTVKVDGNNITVNWYREGSNAVQHTLTFTK